MQKGGNTCHRWIASHGGTIMGAALIAILAFFALPPIDPLQGQDTHWIEETHLSQDKEYRDLFKVYSALRAYRSDLSNLEAWEIAEAALIESQKYKSDPKAIFKIDRIVRAHSPDLMARNSWAIAQTILRESLRHSLDPMLVLAVIRVESNFQNWAVSPLGARGLMQIQPAAAQEAIRAQGSEMNATDEKLSPDLLHNPIINIKLGISYLKNLRNNFRDLKLALTAYNIGPTEIQNRLDNNEEVPEEYAMKVLSAYRHLRQNSRATF